MSGNANHGIAVGTTFAYDRFNNPNGCVEFNGVYSIIRVAHSDSLDLGGYQESYSVSFWCQSEDPIISGAGSARFIEKWNSLGSTPYPLSIIIFGDDIKASVYDMSNTSQPYVNDVFGDQWLNIVVVNNYDTDSVSIFLNGVMSDQVENISTVNTSNNMNITFGNNHIENRPFAGLMDDIRIYSRALTNDEIISIFNNDTVNNDTLNIVQNIGSKEFSIFPNPVSDKLTIESDNIQSIMVFNELGELKATIVDSKIVDMGKFNNGVYFIRVTNKLNSSVQKVIKM